MTKPIADARHENPRFLAHACGAMMSNTEAHLPRLDPLPRSAQTEPPLLSTLSETARRHAMARFQIIQPFLERGIPLPDVAQHHGVALRTALSFSKEQFSNDGAASSKLAWFSTNLENFSTLSISYRYRLQIPSQYCLSRFPGRHERDGIFCFVFLEEGFNISEEAFSTVQISTVHFTG